MSVKTSHRRTARMIARRLLCIDGGQLHRRAAGADRCRDCGAPRPVQVAR